MIPDPLADPFLRAEPSAAPRERTGRGGLDSPLPMYLLPDTAEVGPSGRLRIGGLDVLDLVGEVGTPAFVYDEEHLRRRCREAVAAWGPGVAYASKAFLCRAMARLAHEEGMAIDVSTGGELHVALAAGVPGRAAGAARQQQVRRRAGAGPDGWGGPDRRRLVRRDRPPGTVDGAVARPRPQVARPGHAWHRGPHP